MKVNRSIPAATVVPVLIYPDVREAEDPAGHQRTFSETLEDVAPEDWGGISVTSS
jgi:hypothetical protein